jgi:alpha-tubulin suppressor-like RCC1 family protein
MTIRSAVGLACAVTLAVAAACRDYQGPSVVASVVVTPVNPTLPAIGATRQLAAEARDVHGTVLTGLTFAWSSSDTTIIRVSAAGLVTAVRLGSATVTATVGAKRGSATVTVMELTLPADRISAGDSHTCALTPSGAAYCWGANSRGQLGDGTTTDRSSPVAVSGGLVFRTISAGAWHTCGVTTGGAAYCWGFNYAGALGDGTLETRTSPVAVGGGLSFATISSGDGHTCGVSSDGAAYCWGNGDYGQLGDGTSRQHFPWGPNIVRTAPVAVLGGLTFLSVGVGSSHSCGLTSSGTAYCWGSGHLGQLGDGVVDTEMDLRLYRRRSTPGVVAGGLSFRALSTRDDHVAGVTTGGAVYTWGSSHSTYSPTGGEWQPTLVAGLTSVDAIAEGGYRACALMAGGSVQCWNYGNSAVAVPGGIVFRALTVGYSHACGLTAGGDAYCWGSNRYGQVGDGTTGADLRTPVAVAEGLGLRTVVAGTDYTCGLVANGAAYCWGKNGQGQLGDGTTDSSTSPAAVAGSLTFQVISVDRDHTCGVSSSGTPYCWGSNLYGQLGDSSVTSRTGPVAVGGGLSFQAIAAGGTHSCGLSGTGAAYCWGYNGPGQLGDGTTSDQSSPVAVIGGLTFQAISAGGSHTCGLAASGAAYCWGYNTWGQLGDGSWTSRFSPVAVGGGLTFRSISAGGSHTCALTAAGAAYCWGYGYPGSLGDGTNTYTVTAPVAVAGGLTFQSISAGSYHTCGVTTEGVAYCWGSNEFGQLGSSTITDLASPFAVAGGLTFQSISAGSGHSCGITSGGGAYCWGAYAALQSGDGAGYRANPTRVVGGIVFGTPGALFE